jgi:hypothetical protein
MASLLHPLLHRSRHQHEPAARDADPQAIIRCLADALPERADAGSGEAGLSSLRTLLTPGNPRRNGRWLGVPTFADGLNTYTVTPSYGNCRRRALTLLACDAVALVMEATITLAFVIRAT